MAYRGVIIESLKQIPKEQWYTFAEICKYMENTIELTEEDWEVPEGKKEPNWKLNVRATISRMKKEGYVNHQLRIDKNTPEQYMFGEKGSYVSVMRKKTKKEGKVDSEVKEVVKGKRKKSKYGDALRNMNKDIWYTIEEIYEYVEKLGIIDEEERQSEKSVTSRPIWKHNIHGVIAHMKKCGELEYKEGIAASKSLTGEKIPAMYKFL